MEDKYDLDRLLVSYLLKELDPEEEAQVFEKINSNPELFQYFEELKKISRLLDIRKNIQDIDLGKEREHFEKIRFAEVSQILSEESRPEEAEQVYRSRPYRLIKTFAAAASVILVLGTGWWIFSKQEVKKPVIVETKNVNDEETGSTTRHEVNVSGTTKQFMLEDGSEIRLWDKSEVTFSDFFSEAKRDIELIGKAGFKVARDTLRPFTVFSGDLATTALGTEFIVTNFEEDQKIIIRLLEGHVVVNSTVKAKMKLKQSIHLWAGQELFYNKRTAAAVIRKSPKQTAGSDLVNSADSIQENPVVTNSKGSWFMFNNQSLSKVFDQLEQMFGVQIDYNESDMQKLYFIGKFDKTDSLEYILKNIAHINQLTISKQGQKFTVRK